MISQKRAYAAGHFELKIDGHSSTTYLKSVDGGFISASQIDEPIGGINEHIKHLAVVEIEPITVELGMAGAADMMGWIQASWRKKFARHNGQITHANFDLQRTFTHEFSNALIVETTIPALDGSSKDGAYLKVKLQPEHVTTSFSQGGSLLLEEPKRQKQWAPSNFRINLSGIEDMLFVNKLDSFTIKQGVKKLYLGEQRFPEIEPTKIEFPNLTGTIAVAYTKQLFEWYDHYLAKGQSDIAAQKHGSIEFLGTDNEKVLFEIKLFEVGLKSLKIEPSTANADGIKRAKFELYVGRMELADRNIGFG